MSGIAVATASIRAYVTERRQQMHNRERDKMNKNTGSTSGSDVNRDTSSRIGKDKVDSSAGFDKSSGQSEKLNDPNSRGSSSGNRQ
jgi:hypothetical protein